MSCFRYFNFASIATVDAMTIPEYNMLMTAAGLREVDKMYHDHLTAFASERARAQKRAGKNKTKPLYDRFEKFFDYKKAIRNILHPEKTETEMQKRMNDPHFADLIRKMYEERG